MLLPRRQSSAALALMMASTAVIPFTVFSATASSALTAPYQVAQRFPDSWRNTVPSGTTIPITYDKDKIIVTPGETTPVKLEVASDISTSGGEVMIPAGSIIEGELTPAGDGTQFVAKNLVIDDEDVNVPIEASSDVITRREIINQRSNPKILEGAAIGGAAAAVLSEIFGRIDLWEVLGGAGLGALGSILIRDRDEVEVIMINPQEDLDLTLDSDFSMRQSSVR
jgi:DNA/RNA endonuclease YhcR with UshA esterase domain